MSDTVISVENVSKLYRLGTISSGTLSHDLTLRLRSGRVGAASRIRLVYFKRIERTFAGVI